MNRKDIVIGLVILAVIAGAVYFFKRPKQTLLKIEEPTIEQVIEGRFKLEIPEDVEKAELKDVTGGTSSGIATRKFENGRFSHQVLADLPEPQSGEFYEGWLVRGKEGEANFALISTGQLRVAKGGYLVEFDSTKDYSDYKNVVITSEKQADKTLEKHLLEGGFK